jgi:hypothetical protein
MVTNSLIENNLIIGNSVNSMAAPFQFKGCKKITVRANTIIGDLPGGSFGLRIGTEGSNLRSSGFFIANNIWCDYTGTMTNRFINAYGDVDIASIGVDHNLFWNNGGTLPSTGAVLPTADANRVTTDPLLERDQSNIVLPVWDETHNRFASGSTTVREEFMRLVNAYGSLGEGSAAVDAADASTMPADDILGRRRDSRPDIGAFERSAATVRQTAACDNDVHAVVIRDFSDRLVIIASGTRDANIHIINSRGRTVASAYNSEECIWQTKSAPQGIYLWTIVHAGRKPVCGRFLVR